MEFCEIARGVGAYLLHDCTYRDFAENHVLAADLYPEGAITIYSFSKWLGLAGLRIGAVVADHRIIERLAPYSAATLGSSVVAQRAAQAGLAVSDQSYYARAMRAAAIVGEELRCAVQYMYP